MYKKILGLSLGLLFVGALAFADNMETITLTTYYPSPYGVYFQLATKRLSVGLLLATDQPNRDGSIRFQPQTGNPGTWAAGKQGELAYNGDADYEGFYHYDTNKSAWVGDSSASGTVMYLDCPWIISYLGIGSCTPPNCPVGWTSTAITNSTTGTSMGASSYSGLYTAVTGKTTNVCVKN